MRLWPEPAAAVVAPALAPVLAALALAASAGAQDASPFAGSWCAENGEIMYVEPGSIGFNEHTVCDLPVDLPEGGALVARLACANIYFNDGEAVRAFERSVEMRAELAPDGLMLSLDQEQPALWTRCNY